jgi:putative hemolysin
MENNWTPIIAAVATIFGGIGVEVIRRMLGRSSDREVYAMTLRQELREEIKSLKDDLAKSQEELDEWKSKCYELMSEALQLHAQLERLKLKLQQDGTDEQI